MITGIDHSKHRDMILKSNIEYEISVLTNKEAGGGFKILIANAEGKYEKEAVSKIKFSKGYKPEIAGAIIKDFGRG